MFCINSAGDFAFGRTPMNPVFTLNYPELLVAEALQKLFKPASNYSVLIPLSAQQKGYDLALMRRTDQGSKVATFQVKSSRTYLGTSGVAPRTKMRNFAHYMWLKRFAVPPEADFFILIGQYASNPTSQKNTANLWQSHFLLFTHAEMATFMSSVRQKKQDKPDGHFGFGFDTPDEAFWTRGHSESQHPDYSTYILTKRITDIAAKLEQQEPVHGLHELTA